MIEGTAATQEDASGASDVGDAIVIRLPATSGYISVLRTVTASLAARLDFTLDEIEDLRIAVDEACGLLLAQPLSEGELECEYHLDGDTMRVLMTAPTVDGNEPSRETFAWNVLTALVSTVDAQTASGNRVTILLHKQRGAKEPV